MSISIRPAREEDIEALMALDAYLPVNRERASEIGEWVADGTCIVAEIDGKPMGYAALGQFFRQPIIDIVMVAAQMLGEGVGRALVQHLCEGCAVARIWASTNRSNLTMQSLLAGQGFAFAGELKGLSEDDPERFYYKSLPG